MNTQSKWDTRYLELAKHVAEWSKDPSRKIGAVAVGDAGQILSLGYNGFPRGIEDTNERLTNREEKYKLVVHAEMNVIYNASLNGVSLRGSTLYISGLPMCSDCVRGVIQVGIKRVVMTYPVDIGETWHESWKRTETMLKEAGIEYAAFCDRDRSQSSTTAQSEEVYSVSAKSMAGLLGASLRLVYKSLTGH